MGIPLYDTEGLDPDFYIIKIEDVLNIARGLPDDEITLEVPEKYAKEKTK